MNQPQAEVIAERIVASLFTPSCLMSMEESQGVLRYILTDDRGKWFGDLPRCVMKAVILAVLNESSPTTPGEE